MGRLGKFLALAPADRWLLIRAFAALVGAAVAVRLVPLSRLGRPLPAATPPVAAPVDDAARRSAERIAWAVRTAAGQLPWTANCLAQAAAATWLLRRERIPSVLYVGVERGGEAGIAAHAWVAVAGDAVVGGETRERYTVVATFV